METIVHSCGHLNGIAHTVYSNTEVHTVLNELWTTPAADCTVNCIL